LPLVRFQGEIRIRPQGQEDLRWLRPRRRLPQEDRRRNRRRHQASQPGSAGSHRTTARSEGGARNDARLLRKDAPAGRKRTADATEEIRLPQLILTRSACEGTASLALRFLCDRNGVKNRRQIRGG